MGRNESYLNFWLSKCNFNFFREIFLRNWQIKSIIMITKCTNWRHLLNSKNPLQDLSKLKNPFHFSRKWPRLSQWNFCGELSIIWERIIIHDFLPLDNNLNLKNHKKILNFHKSLCWKNFSLFDDFFSFCFCENYFFASCLIVYHENFTATNKVISGQNGTGPSRKNFPQLTNPKNSLLL